MPKSAHSHPLPWVDFHINYRIFHSSIPHAWFYIFLRKPHTTTVSPGKAQILRPCSSGTLIRGNSNAINMAQTSSLKIFTPFIGHLQYHFRDFVQFSDCNMHPIHITTNFTPYFIGLPRFGARIPVITDVLEDDIGKQIVTAADKSSTPLEAGHILGPEPPQFCHDYFYSTICRNCTSPHQIASCPTINRWVIFLLTNHFLQFILQLLLQLLLFFLLQRVLLCLLQFLLPFLLQLTRIEGSSPQFCHTSQARSMSKQ